MSAPVLKANLPLPPIDFLEKQGLIPPLPLKMYLLPSPPMLSLQEMVYLLKSLLPIAGFERQHERPRLEDDGPAATRAQ